MKTKLLLSGLFCSTVFALAACQKDSGSSLKHDAGQFVSEKSETHQEMTRRDFYQKWLKGRNLQPISENDILNEASQYWLDRLDDLARKTRPEQLANVPKPKAIVVYNKALNAFVSPAFTCVDVGLKNAMNGKKVGAVFLDFFNSFGLGNGAVIKYDPNYPCTKVSVKKFNQLASSFNKQNFRCRMIGTGSDVSLSSSCKVYNNHRDVASTLPPKFKTGSVFFLQNANWVTIHTGLFANLDSEEKFVAVIAHELAHYYRTHSATFEDYDFYYKLLDTNRGMKPRADHALARSGDKAFKAAELKRNIKSWEAANRLEAPVRAELFLGLGSFIAKKCDSAACEDTNCSEVTKLWKNKKDYQDFLGRYPYSEDVSFANVKKVDDQILSCLASIPASKTTADSILSEIAQLSVNPVGYLPSTASKLAVVVYKEKSLWFKNSGYDNTKQIYEDLQGHIQFLDDASTTIFARSVKSNLGQYTTEQEADDMSLEFLAGIGVDPISAAKLLFDFAPAKDQFDGFIYGKEKCKELFENNWQNADGEDVTVPIGDYAENHHSGCYRAFNVSRELEEGVHDYEVANVNNLGYYDWNELRERAKTLNSRYQFATGSEADKKDKTIHDHVFDPDHVKHSCIFSH